MAKLAVVVPNWNGADSLAACLDSLLKQSLKHQIIVVDNGSTDGSLRLLEKYPAVEVIRYAKNLGFAGGVNAGFRRAIEDGLDYVGTLNNDALADKQWLKNLLATLEAQPKTGIVTSKILNANGTELDSTGDYYTNWGLPYPRGRGETDLNKYDQQPEIFGASGGASLYRVKMLQEIGLFDEDFFAYYEDVDLSFRAQLAGWKVRFVPAAVVHHQIGATSSKLRGFTTYQTMKNLPLLWYKNVPLRYRPRVGRRLKLVLLLFWIRAISLGQGWAATRGAFMGNLLLFKKIGARHTIHKGQKVPNSYIWDLIIHDLPPNARALRKLRAAWWRLRSKQ